ncbi:nuclear transport factor 2 [Syncephalastrum racemosum]|uniref:NTF2-related export protein n=1 Tax=Syncephalastrum racemosum TaxID=13706 RepID=A0A1X2HLS4_SYNRA|nr:nuclear transport factor 2 [Syncephalastrum racemosum]
MDNLVASTAERHTQEFVHLFYQNYDTQRNLICNLYRPDSAILWNGNPIVGPQQYAEFLAQLPATQHDVEVFDCQPIPSTTRAEGTSGIVVNVAGSVKYGDSPNRRTFSQNFVLMPEEGNATNLYIQNDNFRFV